MGKGNVVVTKFLREVEVVHDDLWSTMEECGKPWLPWTWYVKSNPYTKFKFVKFLKSV